LAIRDLAVGWLAMAAVFTDVCWQRIPNVLTVSGAILGLALNVMILGPAAGLRTALLGLVVGLALPLVFFALGGMGGGDVKLLGAIGAVVGPRRLLSIFIYAALAGALVSLIMLVRRRRGANLKRVTDDVILLFLTRAKLEGRTDGLTIAYSLPVAMGVYLAILFGDLW
jgi:prepilin peptidase CpaA